MTQALAGGSRTPASPRPATRRSFGEKVAVPSVVGLSEADAATRLLEAAGFNVRRSPRAGGLRRSPPGRSSRRARPGTAVRGSFVTLTLSNGQPPVHRSTRTSRAARAAAAADRGGGNRTGQGRE